MHTKFPSTSYFVLAPNVALPTVNTTKYDGTTRQANINTGVGAFYKPVVNSNNPIEINGAPGAAMQFIYRRDTSQDRTPQWQYHYNESAWIGAHCFNGLNFSQSLATDNRATNNSHLFGAAITTTGQIPLNEDFEYKFQVSFRGDRKDLTFGPYNTFTIQSYFTSPEWSATTYTDAQQLDITVESLVENFNAQAGSTGAAVAICIESAGTTGAGGGAFTISDLSDGTVPLGTVVTIGYRPTDGMAVTLTLDADIQASFVELQTALAAAGFATATMKPYLTAANTAVPAGVPVAGTTATCDHIYVIALDERQAFYDRKMNVKDKITVGLVEGFDGVTTTQISQANEGSGTGRQIAIEYRNHQEYRDNFGHTEPASSYSAEFPNQILADGTYDLFTVEHCGHRTNTGGNPAFNNHTTVIAVLSFEDDTTPYFTGVANPQKTYIINSINAFITANGLGNPTL